LEREFKKEAKYMKALIGGPEFTSLTY
jgi:hypothetical protein